MKLCSAPSLKLVSALICLIANRKTSFPTHLQTSVAMSASDWIGLSLRLKRHFPHKTKKGLPLLKHRSKKKLWVMSTKKTKISGVNVLQWQSRRQVKLLPLAPLHLLSLKKLWQLWIQARLVCLKKPVLLKPIIEQTLVKHYLLA